MRDGRVANQPDLVNTSGRPIAALLNAARVSFATIGSPASSVVTDSKFKRPCTSTFYTLLGRLDQSNNHTLANFYTPALAVHNSQYTLPASESHLHTFRRMCHVRSADLQLEGLIKLQLRDRICIRTRRV